MAKRRRNIVIGILCGILLLMSVGYAAFQSILNIEGTTSITSNWNVLITSVVEKEKNGSAESVEGYPLFSSLSASLNVNLVSPGDFITYDVTVENKGTINAELKQITANKNDNQAILLEYSGITQGEKLNAGASKTFTVKVGYSQGTTSQPENTSAEMQLTLDYVQEGTSSFVPDTSKVSVGGQDIEVVTEGDGLYADPNPEEPGRYVYAGANPDNYITFNKEVWRIISIEANGELKIMKDPAHALPKRAFDTEGKRTTGYCSQGEGPDFGCNVYAQTENYTNADGSYTGAVESDSEMKTYLENDYYSTISTNTDAIVTDHTWYYGSTYSGVYRTPSDYTITKMVQDEKKYSFTSNIGLIQVSDYIKANSDTVQCGTAELHWDNYSTCGSTNWMRPPEDISYDMLSPNGSDPGVVHCVGVSGFIGTCPVDNAYNVVPSLYLNSTIHLEGNGTQGEPYKIESVS